MKDIDIHRFFPLSPKYDLSNLFSPFRNSLDLERFLLLQPGTFQIFLLGF
jgi:hypothetical protein